MDSRWPLVFLMCYVVGMCLFLDAVCVVGMALFPPLQPLLVVFLALGVMLTACMAYATWFLAIEDD